MLERGELGDAGRTVVVEAFLEGEEISVMAVTDGRDVELLPVAQDHKRLLRGRHWPQHRRHGRLQPGVAREARRCSTRQTRHPPTQRLEGCGGMRTPFSGVLYAGLMMDPAGVPVGGGVQLPAG